MVLFDSDRPRGSSKIAEQGFVVKLSFDAESRGLKAYFYLLNFTQLVFTKQYFKGKSRELQQSGEHILSAI